MAAPLVELAGHQVGDVGDVGLAGPSSPTSSRTASSVMTLVSKVVLEGIQPVASQNAFSRSGEFRYSRKAAAACGSSALLEMPSPCTSSDRLAGELALAEDRHDHVADLAARWSCCRRAARVPIDWPIAELAGDDEIDAGIEFERGHVLVEEAARLQLLEPHPVLVIFRVAEILVADEELDRLAERVEILRAAHG